MFVSCNTGAGRLLLGAAGIAGFFALWQVVVSVGLVDVFFVGSPLGAVREGVQLLPEGKIWVDAIITTRTLAYGLGLALILGIPVSVVLGRWPNGWNAVELPILMLNATPTVALVIPIIILVGIGPTSKAVLAFIGAIVPIIINGRAGAAAVPDAYIRAARVYGAGRLDVFFKVVLPFSLLAVLSGVRLGVGRALTAVLVGEMYATQHGLGLWVSQSQYGMNANLLIFVTIFVATVGALLIGAVNVLDRSFAKWRS
jgi:ABC-type nitrate/sulfonate/bicarbonate transport system permease component